MFAVEHRETEALLGFEEPAQVTAPVPSLEKRGSSNPFTSSNVLNEAQRLNDLNVLNKLPVAPVNEVANVTGHKWRLARGIESLLECDFHS